MEKSLYTKPQLCFGVERPTEAQAKVIYDWAIANGARHLEGYGVYPGWEYFGVDPCGNTLWSNIEHDYYHNTLTFAEFAELAGVEVSS